MFDFGISELMIIGAVGLVVLGPERLPVVARTAGQWMSKAQRLVQQVKSDIEREAELSELKEIQNEAKAIAEDLDKTVKGEAQSIEKDFNDIKKDVDETARQADESIKEVTAKTEPAAAVSTETTATETSSVDFNVEPDEDFYGWETGETAEDYTSHGKVFDKRYRSAPSVEELAAEVERLRAELGCRSRQMSGGNRRYLARARSNKVRIYR